MTIPLMLLHKSRRLGNKIAFPKLACIKTNVMFQHLIILGVSLSTRGFVTKSLMLMKRSRNVDDCSIVEDIEEGNFLKPKKVKIVTPKKELSPFRKLIKNKTFLCYVAAIMCFCLVRDGILTWIQQLVIERRGVTELSHDTSSVIGVRITFGGFFGGVFCGIVSDYIFKSSRQKPILLFSGFQTISLFALYYYADASDAVVGGLVFITSTFVLGNYTLFSYTIPSDLPTEIVALGFGILTMSGYLARGFLALDYG